MKKGKRKRQESRLWLSLAWSQVRGEGERLKKDRASRWHGVRSHREVFDLLHRDTGLTRARRQEVLCHLYFYFFILFSIYRHALPAHFFSPPPTPTLPLGLETRRHPPPPPFFFLLQGLLPKDPTLNLKGVYNTYILSTLSLWGINISIPRI